MRREHLEHVLRAASQIAGDPDVLIIGSQSVLGTIPEDRLPPEATASIEVDVAFFDDPDDHKADQIDGAIGELSPFHETFGYYAQGVSVSTATLPAGWRDRLVLIETRSTAPGRGYLLDPSEWLPEDPTGSLVVGEPVRQGCDGQVRGEDPQVSMTRRAADRLTQERSDEIGFVHPEGSVILRDTSGDVRWWTWAGLRANATLAATLSEVVDPIRRFDDHQIRLREDLYDVDILKV